MDPILFPYESKREVELLRRKKINSKAHLVLSSSLAVLSNEAYTDTCFLNGEKIENIYITNGTTYHVVDESLDLDKLTMSLDMDLRLKNMTNYTIERILASIFYKLFSTSLVEAKGQELKFEKPFNFSANRLEGPIQDILDKLIDQGLDIKSYTKSSNHFMRIESLASSRISYPVLSNTAELKKVKLDLKESGPYILVSYKNFEQIEKEARQNKKIIDKIKSISEKNSLEESYKTIATDYEAKKDQVERLKKAFYKLYLDQIIDNFEIGNVYVSCHKIENEEIEELSYLAKLDKSDISLFIKDEGEMSNFILLNKTSLDLDKLIERLEEIYKLEIHNDKPFVRGRLKTEYAENFRKMFKNDLVYEIKNMANKKDG